MSSEGVGAARGAEGGEDVVRGEVGLIDGSAHEPSGGAEVFGVGGEGGAERGEG